MAEFDKNIKKNSKFVIFQNMSIHEIFNTPSNQGGGGLALFVFHKYFLV